MNHPTVNVNVESPSEPEAPKSPKVTHGGPHITVCVK